MSDNVWLRARYSLQEGVFYPNDPGARVFRYSDGTEFEQNLYSIIAGAQDKSLLSRELERAITSWQLRCHLSSARANILRPLEPALRKRNVLELGAGCGAVTRYLGEAGAQVLALEASSMRTRILRERTSDQSNVEVVCERIENFRPEKTYELVTLIGVLQYARLFSDLGGTAEEALLSCSADMVSPDGALLVAIQNPLGLRYWGGWPEPNADVPYFGIENRYGDRTVVRFGLQQLRKRLAAAGLSHTAVFFPLPDYHIASTVLTEAGMNGEGGFNPADIVAMSEAQGRRHPDFQLPPFSMEQAWQQVFDEGLGQSLANAFVVLAARSENALQSIVSQERHLGWHYSVDRPSHFATSSRFFRVDGKITVEKQLTYATPTPDDLPFEHLPASEDYVVGSLWWIELISIINEPNWTVDQVSAWANIWLDALLKASGLPKIMPLDDAEISGEWFDANALNLVRTASGEFHFFDLEWKFRQAVPLRFLAFRLLFGSLSMITSCASPNVTVPTSLCSLSEKILETLGFTVDQAFLEEYLIWHYEVQGSINCGSMAIAFATWRADMLSWQLPSRETLGELINKGKLPIEKELVALTTEAELLRARVSELEAAVLRDGTIRGSVKRLLRALRSQR